MSIGRTARFREIYDRKMFRTTSLSMRWRTACTDLRWLDICAREIASVHDTHA